MLLFFSSPTHAAQVAAVLDGDTIRLTDGKTVRYFGINTPEYGQPFAEEAKHYNEQLVLGKEVRIVSARRRPDAYKHILAYVYVNNTLINAQLITAGLAHVFILDPFDTSDDWLRLQHGAQTQGKGMWRSGGVQGPLKITIVYADARGNDHKNQMGNTSASVMSARAQSIWLVFRSKTKSSLGMFSQLAAYGQVIPLSYQAALVRQPSSKVNIVFIDTGPVWNNTGDTAFLFDPDGNQIDSFPVRAKRLTPPRQAR